jgi:NAD(P)-dependent dehydrogenase (short-subunit alcohol dehydrogenase family)
VNNAGYQGVFAPVDKYPIEDARRVLEVNVLGVLNVLSAAAHTMTGGAIVNIASMAGVSGAPNMPAYSASKAAIVGLTKAAAKDLAPVGIRVNAVSPGFVGRAACGTCRSPSRPPRARSTTHTTPLRSPSR